MILPPLRGSKFAFPLAIVLCAVLAVPLQAVIIAVPGSDDKNGTSPPADDPGWNYVGQLNGCSCVYLGNGWVVTCAHVGAGNPTINGATYNMIGGSNINLHQSAASTTNIDLVMFRINTQSPQPLTLPSLPISKDSPVGASVTAIGNGMDQSTTLSNWVVGGNTVSGYSYGSDHIKRWGTNTVIGSTPVIVGSWTNWDLYTIFNNGVEGSEFQYASGDSGGGLFVKDAVNNLWNLAGVNEAVNSQVDGAALFGDISYAVDLSRYRDQIVSAVQVYQFSGTLNNPRAILGNVGQPDWQKMQLLGDGGFGDSTGNWFIPIDVNSHKFTVSCSNKVVLNGAISSSAGAGEFIKGGLGKLTLSASNTLSGPTTVNGGTLELAPAGTLGNSPITVNAGNLQIDAMGKTLIALTLANNGIGLSIVPKAGATTTVAGALTLTNGGSYSLSPLFDARPTAGTTYNILTAGSVSGTGTSWGLVLENLQSRVTGTAAMSDNTLQLSLTTGAADLTWRLSSGAWNLAAANNFTNAGSNDVFKTFDAVTFDDTVVSTSPKTIILDSSLVPSAITVNNTSANGNYVFSGGSIAGACPLTKTGSGSLTINAANTYFGGTTISGGSLVVGNAAALGTGAVNVNGGTLDVGAFAVDGIGPLVLTNNGTIQGTGSLSALSFEAQVGTISAILTGPAALKKTTGGTVSLSGNNSYAGGTNLAGGILNFSNGSLGSSGQIAFTGNATLQWANSSDLTNRVFIGDGVNATFDTNGNTANISQPINWGDNHTGALTKTGSGILFLNGQNSFSGSVSIAGGTLKFSLWSLGSTCPIVFAGNSTLQWNASDAAQDSSISSRLILNDGVTASINTNGNNVKFSHSLALGTNGTAALTKSGIGTLTLSSPNYFSGNTNISLGILDLANANALLNSTLNYSSSGSLTFDSGVASHAFILGGLSGSKAITLSDTASNSIALSVGNNGANTTFSGAISGSGSLAKIGSGTLTLSAANLFNGNTNISLGILDLADSNALLNSTLNYSSSGSLTFDSGVTSHAFILGGLSGSKAITLSDTASNSIALSVGNNGANTTFSGAISGGGSLAKIGSGTLTLTGPLSYTGNTTVSGGSLIAASINSPTSSVSVTSASSTLTVGSIRVGTLAIGSAAGASGLASTFAAQAGSAVPEPSSNMLFLLGLFGLGASQCLRPKR